ncbi:MAG TPA: ABC transporter permease [Thermodesulfobacteriota bacterium]|nr:ABC transporter permease [Thermodesulfobacteriota bacterium]
MLLLKIILRNALRNKLRTGLTILGIAIAILSFSMLRTLINAWNAGVESSSATRLITRNAVSLVFPLPLSYRDRIRQVTGVKIVSYGTWFGGVYVDEKNFFPNFAVDPETFLAVYPEFLLPPAEKESFLRDRKGFVAGRRIAEKFGWRVGDIVTLKGRIYIGDWDFVLRGIYRGRDPATDETQFIFHWDYLNETLKKRLSMFADQVGYYIIEVTRPEIAGEVAAAVDSQFKNSLAETLTETEKAFQQGFVAMSGAIITAIQVVSLVVIVIILVVVVNTMVMTTRERTGEYAVLKTLGFTARHIAALIFGESILITLSGCLVGVLATFPAVEVLGYTLGTYFPVMHVDNVTVLLNFTAALAVAFAAAVIPTARAVRVRIAAGLRRVG